MSKSPVDLSEKSAPGMSRSAFDNCSVPGALDAVMYCTPSNAPFASRIVHELVTDASIVPVLLLSEMFGEPVPLSLIISVSLVPSLNRLFPPPSSMACPVGSRMSSPVSPIDRKSLDESVILLPSRSIPLTEISPVMVSPLAETKADESLPSSLSA